MVGVVQLVERQVVILNVAGSSPVTHPNRSEGILPSDLLLHQGWPATPRPTADLFPSEPGTNTGTRSWGTTRPTQLRYPGALVGYEVYTTIGSFTNDDFIVGGLLPIVPIPIGTQIDVADFGGGYANDWIDVPGTGLGSPLFRTAFG